MKKELTGKNVYAMCDEVSFLPISFIVTATTAANATAIATVTVTIVCILYACISIIIKSLAFTTFNIQLGPPHQPTFASLSHFTNNLTPQFSYYSGRRENIGDYSR